MNDISKFQFLSNCLSQISSQVAKAITLYFNILFIALPRYQVITTGETISKSRSFIEGDHAQLIFE